MIGVGNGRVLACLSTKGPNLNKALFILLAALACAAVADPPDLAPREASFDLAPGKHELAI